MTQFHVWRTHVQRTVSRCFAALYTSDSFLSAVGHTSDKPTRGCTGGWEAGLWERGVLVGLPAYLTLPLQSVLNAAARPVPDYCQPRPVAIICPRPLSYARQFKTYLNYMHASESTLDSGTSGTASHSSRHDMLAIISSRYQYGPFFVAEVMSSYLTY